MNHQRTISKTGRITEFIFFGNYFYGVCAVALSIEAMLQQRFPLNQLQYFLLVFAGTVLYYTYPYVRKCSFISGNRRTNWYTRNHQLVIYTQIIFTMMLAIAFVFFVFDRRHSIAKMNAVTWTLLLIFPLVAALYYGNSRLSRRYNLRKIGWLKPFVIGFTWGGLVTIYPVIYYCIRKDRPYEFTLPGALLFMKNLMFVAVLCIMFDIKDYATDYVHRLRTFVVGMGLRRTIFSLLVPVSIAGLVMFVCYASSQGFHWMKILLNVLPFVLLIRIAWTLARRRSLMYYLVIVDGLMLVKALCGIVAIIYF